MLKCLEAQPKRVFDKEARRALRKWKYKPKVVDGVPSGTNRSYSST